MNMLISPAPTHLHELRIRNTVGQVGQLTEVNAAQWRYLQRRKHNGETIFNSITSPKYTPDEADRAVTSIKDGVSRFPGQTWIAQTGSRGENGARAQTWARADGRLCSEFNGAGSF